MLTDTDFKRIQKLFAPVATRKDVARVEAKLLDVKTDVAVLKSDVRELRGEMQWIKLIATKTGVVLRV